MKNFCKKNLIVTILFILCSTQLFAGIYEYEFKDKMFDSSHTTVLLNDIEWTLDVNNKQEYSLLNCGYSSNNGQKFGTNKPSQKLNPLEICTNDIKQHIKSISIWTCAEKNNNVECSITVGDSTFKCNNFVDKSISNTLEKYIYTGNGTGEISIKWRQKADDSPFYIKKIRIEYEGGTDKQEQTLRFPQDTYYANIEDKFIAPQVSGAKTPVTYSSSNPDIASVNDSTGAVTLKKKGTTTITASAKASNLYYKATASYVLNVKSKYCHTTTFDFTRNEDFGVSFDKVTFVTIKSIHSKDIVLSANKKNNFHKSTKGVIRFKLEKSGEMSLSAPNGMTIDSIHFTGEELSNIRAEANGESHSDGKWQVDAPSITFSTDALVAFKSAKVFYSGAYELNMSKIGYSTLSASQAYTMPEGLQGGIINVHDNTANIQFYYQPGDIVPANEALILKGEQGLYKMETSFTTNGINPNNDLLCAYTNDTIDSKANHELFILSLNSDNKLGFYYQWGCKDGSFLHDIAYKAYLEIPKSLFENGHRGLRLNIEPTGIRTPISRPRNTEVYEISGKMIQNKYPTNLPKGIYIINGKKSFIK